MPDTAMPSLRLGDFIDAYEEAQARHGHADLSDPWLDRVQVSPGDRSVVIRRGRCVIAANLAPEPRTVPLGAEKSEILLSTDPGVTLDGSRVNLPPESAAVLLS